MTQHEPANVDLQQDSSLGVLKRRHNVRKWISEGSSMGFSSWCNGRSLGKDVLFDVLSLLECLPMVGYGPARNSQTSTTENGVDRSCPFPE